MLQIPADCQFAAGEKNSRQDCSDPDIVPTDTGIGNDLEDRCEKKNDDGKGDAAVQDLSALLVSTGWSLATSAEVLELVSSDENRSNHTRALCFGC